MARPRALLLVVAVVAIGVAVAVWPRPADTGSLDAPTGQTPSHAQKPPDAARQKSPTSPRIPVAGSIPVPPNAAQSHLAYVYDGDTLYLQPAGTTARADEVTVRLIGIDTPELRPEVECYGIEARERLRALLPAGSPVWIASDAEKLDRYGRSLLYLWTPDGRSVNLELVRGGYASALRVAPSDTYWEQFALAERRARQDGAGLWGRC